ncbi:MAG: Glu/Leu/Phe/Val dehydrogenase [Bdellovibrionales bacterium]|nr:Glu/Leu/Phe/Val dehydrogenase [Bdellovibrionales bacterium]
MGIAMKNIYSTPFYANIIKNLEIAGMVNDTKNATIQRLKFPKRCIVVSIPVRMDSGEIKIFDGYRVQHSQTLGPFKGGIRFHKGVNLAEVVSLASLMTLKNSLLGLPLGGAKGGVAVEPKNLSRGELERLTRGFTSAIGPFIGPDKDIPAPDVGTDSQTMAWMLDTYSTESGFSQTGIVTGKPLAIGGSKGREAATGLGVVLNIQKVLEKQNKSAEESSLAIQGFGKVGMHAAIEAHKIGLKVVAISDISTALYDANGLNIPELVGFVKKKNLLKDYDSAKQINNDELLTLPVDILAPCALDGVINSDNMDKIKAKIIVEGANGPTTSKASSYLFKEKKVIIIPDILANGGGVIVSYFEWVQDIVWLFWSEEEVKSKLKMIIDRCFDRVWDCAKKHSVDIRTAAIATALKRLEKAMLLRGQI